MKAHVVTLAVGLIAASVSVGLQARGANELGAVAAAEARALLDQYCVACHNERAKAGSLVLSSADVTRVGEDAVMWEKVVRKLRGHLMPPTGRPRPDETAYEDFVAWLETELDSFAADHPNPGRTETFRRLNRAEYQNAIRDLLALDIDVSDYVPADDAEFGFDNIGGVFRLSTGLVEAYLTAAKRISRMAMGTPPSVLDEGQLYVVPGRFQQHDRVDGLGLGTRGGTLVRHVFPQSAEYGFKIDMGNLAISTEPHTMELTIDGVQLETFLVEPVGSPRETLIYGDLERIFEARVSVPGGAHEIGVTFYRNPPSVPESIIRPFQVATLSNYGGGNPGPGGAAPTVKAVTIAGPFDPSGPGETASRSQILTCRPEAAVEDAACARTILSTLARRAYRRPITEADLQPLLDFYDDGRAEGGFEAGIERALRRLLVSPNFLFRMEAVQAAVADAGGNASPVYQVSDLELASRLSFFLWSSIPDDRLLDLAAEGRLSDPAVLAQEVRRLVVDSRSVALTKNFAGQWLQLRKLGASRPGSEYGKNFDANLKEGLLRETELFFDSIVREDRPVTQLLTADYTFLNERVAQHYGIRDVQGSHFRRVALPVDSSRRGLLGHGSLLTLTSQAIRTSPVTRGKYILETLMGTPPPEPPDDVPALTERKAGALAQTMRERMAAHRANPTCSACHAMIDPLGFALENFDAVGAWRVLDDGSPIDASGTLPDGRKFSDVNELRALMMEYPEQLVTTMTESLLTYAVGRGLEYYDMPAVRKVVHDAAGDDYGFHTIVLGIVNSDPFRMRQATPPAAVTASR